MKDAPEIAPEIRGLLEEIVADPRSAIRLVPRRALRTWFDTDETVRASDVVHTSAERHLVEMHREELAALLCEASWISYWKAPVLSYRPIGEDGRLYEPTQREPEWRRRAGRVVAASDRSAGIELLRQCLEGVEPQLGWMLAQASLGLVPNDKTRFDLALNAMWKRPRTAMVLFNRLNMRARPASLRALTLQSLGSQACYLGLFNDAHEYYRAAGTLDAQSPYGWGCAFALSCFLGDEERAREEARELGATIMPEDPRVPELRQLLREWRKSRNVSELTRARNVLGQIGDRIPRIARDLCEDFNQ
jgi:hypothetical protein